MQISVEQPLKLTIYPKMIVVSKEKLFSGMSKTEKAKIMIENRKTEKNGFMSDATKRKVRKILIAWLTSVKTFNEKLKYYEKKDRRLLTFATLTLSDEQKHSDLFIKRNFLNRFLLKMQRDYNVIHYFWRAERMNNGRIHFHIILDHYVSNRDLQSEWNTIQREYGYIDSYFSKHNHYNPPSTHIRRVDSDEQAIEYAIKYTMKKEANENQEPLPIKGLIWGCSDLLKKLNPYSCMEDTKILDAINSGIKDGVIEVIEDEQYMIMKTDVKELLLHYAPERYEMYLNYYSILYTFLYSPCLNSSEISIPESKPPLIKPMTVKQLELPFDLNPSPAGWTH